MAEPERKLTAEEMMVNFEEWAAEERSVVIGAGAAPATLPDGTKYVKNDCGTGSTNNCASLVATFLGTGLISAPLGEGVRRFAALQALHDAILYRCQYCAASGLTRTFATAAAWWTRR